jgi:hypothetical protein
MISVRVISVCAGMVLLAAPAARADVLVSDPGPRVECGDDIEVGVWYQSYSGGPRNAEIRIKTARGYTVFHRRVRATTTWRYWHYAPSCGRTYTVIYRVPKGDYRRRVRVSKP